MADAPEYETELEPEPPPGKAPLGGLRRRGIYLLPNLFTTGVLFCGFFAIVQAMNGRFEIGCIAIFVAMVLDGMDGRVARWTNTQSEFGAQYDSIADMVAFGAAPALVAYTWALNQMGTLGWIGAFIYCAGAGITMVSNVPFWSFKEVNWKKRVPLWVILACVIAISIIASSPSLVLFLLFFSYAVSGYVMWAMGHRVRPVLPEE